MTAEYNPFSIENLPPESAPTNDNPFSERSIQQEQDLRLNVGQAIPKNPTQAADAYRIAKETNTPVPAVANNFEDMQRQQLIDRYVQSTKDAPVTQNLLKDPDKAAFVHDDIQNMTGVEKALSYMSASGRAGLHDFAAATAKLLDTVQPFTTSDQDLTVLYKNDPEGLKRQREQGASAVLSRFARNQTQDANDIMSKVPQQVKDTYGNLEYQTLDPEKAAYLHPVKVVSDAIRSLPTTAALALTAFLTRGASMKAEQAAIAEGATAEVAKQAGIDAAVHMATRFGAASEGAVGYAQQYNSTQNQVEQTPFSVLEKSPEFQKMVGEGFDPNAARIFLSARTGEQAGVGAGFTDAITNAVGGHFLGKIIGEGGKLLPRTGKGFLTEGTQEFVQSGGEQLAENLALKNNINPEQDLSKGVVESMLQGLAVGGLTGGTFSGIAGRAQRDEEKVQDAGKFAEDVTALNELAKANKVLQRDYSTFEEFAQQAGENGNFTHVFMDAEALMQSGVAEQIAAVSPSVAEQLPLAAESKGTISIPVGEYTAAIARTEYAQALVPIIKNDPFGFSLNEAAEHVQNFQENMVKEMQDVVDKGLVDAEFKQSTARLKEKFQTELDAVGHQTTDVNQAHTTLLGDYFAVNAAKLGMSPEELHNQYALRFASELQQGYDQSGNLQTDTPAFKNWFGKSKVVDAEGKPLVVYHTSKEGDVSVFNPKYKTELSSMGFHFGTKDQAIFRQGQHDFNGNNPTLGEYYLSINNLLRVNHMASFAPDHLADQMIDMGLLSDEEYQAINEDTDYNDVETGDRLVSILKKNGYDGLVYENDREGKGDSYVPFDPTQIKSATGNNGNFDPNDANIYNQSATNLLAVHNLSADNLAFADNLGGLAVPSIGVITSGKGGVDGFGEITLLGTKKLVDPKQERVFSSDAYTARFPSPEWFAVKVKPAQKIVDGIKAVADEFDDSSLVYETWDYLVNTPDANRVVDLWLRSSAIRALYLRSQGEDVAPVMRSVATRSSIPKESVASLQKLFEAVDQDKQIDVMMKTPEYQALVSAYAKKVKEYYKNKGRPELGEKLAESFTYRDFEGLGFDLKNLGREDVDRVDTRSMLAGKIDPHAVAFKQWVEDKVVPAFGDPYIKLGSKKAPYTLNNIVKKMTDSKVKGKEKTMTFNRGQVRATAAVEFSDIEQMREAAKDQINDPAEYKKAMEESEEKVQAYQNAITPFTKLTDWRGNPNIWDAMDGSMKALARWATSKNKSVTTMRSALLKEDFDVSNISDEIIKQAMDAGQSILHAPVPYFEAKPQREVSLDEFAGAVIPTSATQETRDILNKHGIKYSEYQEGEGRGAAVRSLAADLADQGLGTLFQGANTNRGSFNPTNLTISLLKDANLSTFLHETGHFFLEMQFDLAARLEQEAGLFGIENLKPGEQSIIKDANAILNWFGVQDLDTWHRMTLDEKRGFHEQFARGFEAYLFEGNAPSIELQPLFQRFKAWLKEVYKSIKALNVELTDEVRGVFDRMIASEEQIQLAEQARSMMPLFTTLDAAPMTADEFREYQNQQPEATATAVDELDARGLRDMKWLRNARSKVLKAMQKDAKEKRREVRAEARIEVLSQPIYRAWALLTAKINPEDRLPKPTVTKSNPNVVTPEIDSLFAAVAKLGGLNKADLISQWDLDPATKQYSGVFGKPVWRKEGGLTVDGMLEALTPYGYLTLDEHGKPADSREFEDLFDRELRGEPQYSVEHDYDRDQEQRAGSHIVNPYALNAVRFDKGELIVAGISDDDLNKLQAYKMVSKGDGMHQDIIADLILDENGNPEFTSGDDLIQQLLAATPPNEEIEALTDLRMLEKYGDLSSPEAIEKAADKAIHNDVRARLVATEANALAKATGGKKILASAAKMLAATTIARKKIRDLIPSLYTNAEVKAAKSAEKYMRAKDLVNAAAEKRNQLFNMYAAKAAMDARDEIEKGVAKLKRMQSASAQSKMRGEALAQLNNLLARFDLRTSLSLKRIDEERKALAEWVQDEAERLDAIAPDLPDFILDEKFRKHYKDLTVEEFRGLLDSIKQLELLARREEHQYQAIRNQTFAEERAALLGVLRDNFPDAFDEEGKVKNLLPNFVPSLSAAMQKLGDSFIGEMIDPENIIDMLERGKMGAVWESLYGRLTKASDWKADRLKEIHRQMETVFKAYSFKERIAFSREPIAVQGVGSLTRENAVMVALLNGSEDGRSRLMNYGWGPVQINAILENLTDKDIDLVQAIWTQFDSELWPELKALNERTRGKAPPKIAPMPFSIKGRLVSGGYMRLKYDTELDERAHKLDEGQAVKDLLGGGLGMSSKTNQGTSTERKQNVTMRPRLDLGVFSETVTETVHDLAYREAIADTVRMLNDRSVTNAIKSALGTPAYRALLTRVREVAAPPRIPSGNFEKSISWARKNTVIALMSGVYTALQNFTGYFPAMAKIPPVLMIDEIRKFYSPAMFERVRFAMDQSSYMRGRFGSFDGSLQDMAKSLTVNGKILPDEAIFLSLMAFVDRAVAVPVWTAAFKIGMKTYQNDNARATEYADSIVRKTQGSGRDVDLAVVMSGHGGFGQLKKVFTMFYSYFNRMLGLLVTSGAIAKSLAKENPSLAVAKFTGTFLAVIVIPAITTEILMGRAGGDDDEEEFMKHWGIVGFRYVASMIPLFRDVAAGALSIYAPDAKGHSGFKLSPIESMIETGIKTPGSIADIVSGEGNQADVKTSIMGISFMLGLPGKLMSDTVTGTDAFLSGQAGPQAIILGPPKKPR